ncbi:SAM-binding motif [Candidatus Competibacter denitrificans Run_A_D11]|uniref:SAM-binding motif n=1 Tax=Candidatus Competibacter denitrificans Run_A_D11 TaxID=1400863 RepID=W6M2U1_9GAMM|nr:class I SAM-dependent methyltransferase [Candidatus Competibacter denitrificans]CDI00804.1 SAM-binding motif [Candidatus Competibacter denitrificans Run_A_D11]
MRNKQPKLVLRESCIEDLTHSWIPGYFLEVGAGTGYMTVKFLERGFYGSCYDLGQESRNRLRENLTTFQGYINVLDDLNFLTPNTFDYLFAFEVLEHIDDDGEALKHWTKYLKPGGRILITVPAHTKKFGKSDEVVGHIRRYERQELINILKEAGYKNISLINYGFPLTEITRIISNLLISNENSYLKLTPTERSTRSSFSRPQHIQKLLSRLNENIFYPFKFIQRIFYEKDWGDGLVATAQKLQSL